MSAQSNIRIIGGKWRSRKVSFANKEMLRPTPDRVRETLFNWLAPHIIDATCLDLYAGSGVLGLEALSRGAKSVVSIETDPDNIKNIQANKETLAANNLSVINQNVLTWLERSATAVDIVFADPPYKLDLLNQTLNLLEKNGWVHANSLIYFEQDHPYDLALLPRNWRLWREGKAGNVFYYLAIKQHDEN